MIEPELAEALKAARDLERSESQVIREGLREWLGRNGIAVRERKAGRGRVGWFIRDFIAHHA